MKKYYQLTQVEREADLHIYGDITSWPWEELGEVSAYNLSKELAELDVDKINVYINSYGGEVAEGLAIYNSLKRHNAKIVTVCDGFACSIASVIFMAGDERIMNEASLLMIHNAWTWTSGNADELRKEADDLDTINQAAVAAYLSGVNITEEEVKELMNNESWIAPSDALSWGFATAIESNGASDKPSQNARKLLFAKMMEKKASPIQIDEDSIVQKLFEKLKQQDVYNVTIPEHSHGLSGGHNHGISPGIKLAVWGGNNFDGNLTPQNELNNKEPKPEQSLMQTLAGFLMSKI